MNSEEKPQSGCASLFAIVILVVFGIFIWSQISSCISPKNTRSESVSRSVDTAVYGAGERDGKEIADVLAKDGAKRIPTEDGVMLLAQTRARVTNVPSAQVYDWTKGFCAGYNAQMQSLGK